MTLIFSNFGLLIALAALIVAAWFGQVPIVILAGLIAATVGLSKLWSYLSLKRVTYERHLGEHRLFPGEATELRVRITNRKPMPLVWLETEDRLPPGLALDTEAIPQGSLNIKASLLWYQRISWSYHLKAVKRGYYLLGPAQLSSGDIFGLYPRSLAEPKREEIIVYPRVYPLAGLGLPVARLWGDMRARTLFQDATRFMGLRDYRPEDSLRHVHWKASARRGELQVKTFESTATLEALLLVDIESLSKIGEEEFELALSDVASVASHLFHLDYGIGLLTNTATADRGEPVAILPSSNKDQLTRILEALAKTTRTPKGGLEELMEWELRKPAPGTTLVLAAAEPSPRLISCLERYRRLGYRSAMLSVSAGGGPVADLGPIFEVRPPEGSVPGLSRRRWGA